MALQESIIQALKENEPLTDRELTDKIKGDDEGQQAINEACRNMELKGLLKRNKGDLIRNFLVGDKSHELLLKIIDAENIIPDEHSGSYALLQQAVGFYATLDINTVNVDDVQMLYQFGKWKHGKVARDRGIHKCNLTNSQKNELLNLNNKIALGTYSNNSMQQYGNCGMFGGGTTVTVKRNMVHSIG